ncbi:MAG: HdeD family acid-resistance protein [Anaerolineales bacterium]
MNTYPQDKTPNFPWWAVLIQGIFSIVVGILLLLNTAATTLFILQLVGLYWLVSGIFSLVGLFIDRSFWGWKLLSGILGILAGLAVIQHPLWSTFLVPAVLVILLGIEGVIIGLLGLVTAFRGGGWGTGILAALSLVFGVLFLSSPVISGITLVWLFGLISVVGGLASVFMSIRQRSLHAV